MSILKDLGEPCYLDARFQEFSVIKRSLSEFHLVSGSTINKVPKTERYYTVGYAPNGSKARPPPAINLKGQWLKEAGFETGFTFTVKILNGFLVLIPDSEVTRAIKQQNQQQQAQLSEIKCKINELVADQKSR